MSDKKRIELTEKCKACGGTGLYVGLAERDGAAVVCHVCNGTGAHRLVHEYEDFTGRTKRDGVRRVFLVNPGIVIGSSDESGVALEDFGGMPIADWESGKPFPAKSEDRAHTCPAWWCQCADYRRKPRWKACIICGIFSDCANFGLKSKCWERWDAEQAESERVK